MSTEMKTTTTEDLLATIMNFPRDEDAPACATEYLRRCGDDGWFADRARKILADRKPSHALGG